VVIASLDFGDMGNATDTVPHASSRKPQGEPALRLFTRQPLVDANIDPRMDARLPLGATRRPGHAADVPDHDDIRVVHQRFQLSGDGRWPEFARSP